MYRKTYPSSGGLVTRLNAVNTPNNAHHHLLSAFIPSKSPPNNGTTPNFRRRGSRDLFPPKNDDPYNLIVDTMIRIGDRELGHLVCEVGSRGGSSMSGGFVSASTKGGEAETNLMISRDDGSKKKRPNSMMRLSAEKRKSPQPARVSDNYSPLSARNEKTGGCDVTLGPMRMQQHPMSVLLVFGKEDGQSDGFWCAADKAGYKCNLVTSPEAAMETFLEKRPDVVIIDNRTSKYFDAETLCRSIRATKSSDHTGIVEVAKRVTGDKEEPSILPLLQAGFNRRFVENSNVSVCLNELLCLEYGEVRMRVQLSAAAALLVALDNCSDAIEICNDDNQVQYVNPAYEQAFGYSSEELQGRDVRELMRSERNKTDHHDVMDAQVRKGKQWEGVTYTKRKSGESVSHHCKVTPVIGQSSRVRHLVAVRHIDNVTNSIERTSNADINQFTNGGVHGYVGRRRDSVARIHSMMIEAPITKVINIINSAQENSPITVVQALDKVLEILRSSELYSPFLSPAQARDSDPMTSDLVGGLMTTEVEQASESADPSSNSKHDKQSVKRKFSNADSTLKHIGHHLTAQSLVSSTVLTQISPEIQTLLNDEPKWEFDIMRLETITKKRPLVYLGLKTFQRFGVIGYLQVSEQTLVNWLQLMESNYHSSNSYHNSTHAADVMHATAYFLHREKLKGIFDQMDEVAALIAAVVHDLDHPGRTNSFLVNEGNELAVLYNDLAVLESHHVSLAFRLALKDDRTNIFKNLDREDFRIIRQQIVDMVLATEMTRHFEHLSKFVSSINKPTPSKAEDDACSSMSGRVTPSSSACPSDLTTPENRTLIKRMLIKCADVCNPTRPLPTCIEWAHRIAEEYCLQTDEEKNRNLPVVMPVFDRKTCNVPKSQTSFIDFFINSMFDAWDAFCDIPDLIQHLQTNYKYWKDQEEIASKKVAEEETTQVEEAA